MARLIDTLDRVTWLLERVTEVAAGECQGGLSRAALANAKGISEDFALLRPILGALLTIPADPAVNEGFSGMARASSAPAPMKAAAEPDPPEEPWSGILHSSKFNGYVRAGVGQVESFAIATCAPASAYFDAVLAAGLERGGPTEFTAQLFFREIWYGGLQLGIEAIRLSPRLLAKLAQYAVGKDACTKAVIKLLPELCQGASPDAMLAKVIGAKTDVRRGLLKRHMQTLDESEGLQDVTTRLSDRLGIDPRKLRSDLDADIPLHVRQYLAKYERCRTDLEALRDMETQIVVLRAVGAREAENEDTFETSTALMPRNAEGMRNLRDFLSAPAREQGRMPQRSGNAIEKALSEPLSNLVPACGFPPSGPRAARKSADLFRARLLSE